MITTESSEASESEPRSIQILVVEDEGIIARDIKDCLENLGYSVPAIAASGSEAIEKAVELYPDLVLMDIRLKGDMDGIQAAEQIWSRLRIPIVYSTGFSDKNTLERAKITRPFGYILKPVEERELYVAVETALQQYQVSQELQDREQWLKTVVRDIGDGVIVVDVRGQIKLLNLVAEALTGWKQEEAVEKDLSEVFRVIDEQTRAPAQSPVETALQNGTLMYLAEHVLLVSKDGTTVPIADSAAPLRDSNGTITGAVLVFRDVTQRRIVEERNLALRRTELLETQMSELQKLSQLKDDFLNTVSHELRTPLANMKMAIQMLEVSLDQQGVLALEADSESNRIIQYLEILRDQCNQELTLVNDLLDLQRLNADAYTLTLTTLRLQDWIFHVIENFEERIQNNNQQLRVNIPSDLPLIVSDSFSLVRILSELLNNACKYTPAGEEITVTAQVIESSSGTSQEASFQQKLQIRISNSGVEIPADKLPHVFDQFYRIPTLDFWNQGGTGLGLALAKKLATYLGGSVEVETSSELTSFIIELPLVSQDASAD